MHWERDPVAIARKLEDFLAGEPRVRVIEEDVCRLQLAPRLSGYSVLGDAAKAVLHVWSAEGSMMRRIVELRESRRALQLGAMRLGQTHCSRLWLEAAPSAASHAPRQEFRAAMLAAMAAAWRRWRPVPAAAAATSELELFLLRSPGGDCACVAVPPHAARGEAALADLLLWARALGRAGRASEAPLLRLIVSGETAGELAGVLQWRAAGLRAAARLAVFTWQREAGLRPAPELNWANLESTLAAPRVPKLAGSGPPGAIAEIVARDCPAAECVRGTDGRHYFRLHGLTFLRQAAGPDAWLGRWQFADFSSHVPHRRFRPLRPETEPAFVELLRRLDRERQPDGDPCNPLYHLQPESWMEELLRRNLTTADPDCDPRFAYRQVPSFQQTHRDVLDLLAAHRDGTLCLFELKASGARGLPLQALDYWQRVRRHQAAGDFARLGYFPGLALQPGPPRLVLVCPAMQWHANSGALVGELAPEIPVTLLGLNEQWRRGLQVVQRQSKGSLS